MNFVEATSFKDTSVKANTTYTYSVSVRDAKGNYLPGSAATASTPAPPPLSQARLDGAFLMRMRFTEENYTNRKIGGRFRESWTFTPRCDTGPCSVGLRTNRRGEHRARLTRRGAVYSGSGTDTLFTRGRVRGTEKYTVVLRVTSALRRRSLTATLSPAPPRSTRPPSRCRGSREDGHRRNARQRLVRPAPSPGLRGADPRSRRARRSRDGPTHEPRVRKGRLSRDDRHCPTSP
jgi:hypothetical protein